MSRQSSVSRLYLVARVTGKAKVKRQKAKRKPTEIEDARLRLILSQLSQNYGRPVHAHGGDPLDVLIATVLSQNTSDINSHRAFAQLKARFPRWEDVLTARPSQITSAIRLGGLADIKARRIKQILRQNSEDRGELDLTFLRHTPIAQAREYLTAMPGVGPKTAACVLLFSLKMPAFPVDTHVLRVSKRLGLIPPKTTMDRAHQLYELMLASAKWNAANMLALHLGLVQHGRRICIAGRPRCTVCGLYKLCPRVGVTTAREPLQAEACTTRGRKR